MMTKEKYKEVMALRAAYAKGVRNDETRAAHSIYSKWQKDRLVHYMKRKFGKWNNNMKINAIAEVLKDRAAPDDVQLEQILRIMKR